MTSRSIAATELPTTWQRALTAVLTALAGAELGGSGINSPGLAGVFSLLVDGARRCAGSGSAAVTLCVPLPGWLRIAAATGDGAEWTGRLIPLEGSVSALTRRESQAIRVADTASDPRTVQSARKAGIGPSMVAPLYTETGEWDGTLLVGRPPGADQFPAAELEFFAEYARQAWTAITAAATTAARIEARHAAAHDRLTTVLHEVTGHDLAAIQFVTEQLHAQLPPRHWPQLTPLTTAITATRQHVFGALEADPANTADETGPLLTRLLHTCSTVARPLELVEQITVHDPLPGELPATTVDLIGRWLAIALLMADRLGYTRTVDIATRTTTQEQLALTVGYYGRPPSPEDDAAPLTALQTITDELGGIHRIDTPGPQQVRMTWISDPLRRPAPALD
ncbi:GAF domain-containing protein [Amycolatopsis sp. NPDC049252]|uniref:GAF domain-containing protein n=1 Tax=Amycolatopsis sp. NPDC049252 TaxID=3363933 RepID=UPI00371AAF5C